MSALRAKAEHTGEDHQAERLLHADRIEAEHVGGEHVPGHVSRETQQNYRQEDLAGGLAVGLGGGGERPPGVAVQCCMRNLSQNGLKERSKSLWEQIYFAHLT